MYLSGSMKILSVQSSPVKPDHHYPGRFRIQRGVSFGCTNNLPERSLFTDCGHIKKISAVAHYVDQKKAANTLQK
jgi:hypothetical protein